MGGWCKAVPTGGPGFLEACNVHSSFLGLLEKDGGASYFVHSDSSCILLLRGQREHVSREDMGCDVVGLAFDGLTAGKMYDGTWRTP